MENLKIYENFHNKVKDFEQEIKDEKFPLDLWKEPADYRNASVLSGMIKWSAEVDINNEGIEVDAIHIKAMEFIIEQEDVDEKYAQQTIEVPLGSISSEQSSLDTLYGFPFYMTAMTINMNYSKDPQDWKFSFDIGYKD